MRYFTGPESPPSDKGYIMTIERWYVKLYTEADLRFQGRFLVESREFGDGVAAVAPYDTEGFRSPDWSGFQWNEADPTPRAVRRAARRVVGDPLRLREGRRGTRPPRLARRSDGVLGWRLMTGVFGSSGRLSFLN